MELIRLTTCPLEMAVDPAAGGVAAVEQAPSGSMPAGSAREWTVALALMSLGSQGGWQSGSQYQSSVSNEISLNMGRSLEKKSY